MGRALDFLLALLGSLARFEIAGAIVELKDRQSSFEYSGVFTKILTDILSNKDSAEQFYGFISDSSARELARVIRESSVKVPEDDQQIEVQKNIALIVGRKRHTAEAIRIFEALLRKTPNDKELLKNKARFLRESGIAKNIRKSERIYDDLQQKPQYQTDPGIYWGRAQSRCLLEEPNLDGALDDLGKAIENGFWRWGYWKDARTYVSNKDMLDRSWVDALKAYKPERIDDFRKTLREKLLEAEKKKEIKLPPLTGDTGLA